MEKEFVPYELALRLKTLGFDWDCFASYNREDVLSYDHVNNNNLPYFAICSAPTFSQAFRWFREKYDLDGEATRYNLSHSVAKILGVDFKQTKYVYVPIINGEDFPELEDMPYFLLKEEAELACLDKLLEIVESKS